MKVTEIPEVVACRRQNTAKKRLLFWATLIAAALWQPAYGADNSTRGDAPTERSADPSAAQPGTMRIRFKINGKTVTATLADNATARDFISLLPVTLTFEDYAATEKIAYPPRKLSTTGSPAGSDPSVGDIAYYAPWGNLAIFYKDFGYSRGLVILGKIDSGMEALEVPGSVKVVIERIK